MEDNHVVAAFDFDGTITYRDSLLPFLIFNDGWVKTIIKMIMISPTLIGFVLGVIKRQKAKEIILKKFLGGKSIDEIKTQGELYAKGKLNSIVRPEAKERIKWHLDRGDQCVLISASVDVYLLPWAEDLGFQKVISSRLEVSDSGVVTGNLLGTNCWGPEKVRRLEEACGPIDTYTLYAYGDSRGDKELLNCANHPFFKSMGAKV